MPPPFAIRTSSSVRFFLSHGANVNVRTIRGETPVTLARGQGHTELVAMLEKLAGAQLWAPAATIGLEENSV